MKKIVTLLSLLCVLNALMLAGLVGFLMGTGRLDKSKAQAIADMLKHQGTPDKLREQLYDILEPAKPAATMPATRPAFASDAPGHDQPAPATAEERINYAQVLLESERLQLENKAQELRQQQNLLAGLQADVMAKLKLLVDEKQAFEKTLAQTTTKGDGENFQKTMALYDEMKPRQIKDILSAMPADQASRYLGAMAPDRAAKILAEFKTPEEKSFMNSVLDRIRTSGTSAASDKQAGAPSGLSVPPTGSPATPG